MPAPQVSKQVAEEVVKDLPLVEPSPAPEPEVVLPKPKPVEKEEPREEEVQEAVPEEQKPNEAAELRIAAAPLRVEAQEVPSSVPSPRQSASLARARATWQKRLTHQLNRHKRTLPAALSRYRGRVVVVAFTLDRSGKVIASHIAESSGLPALDGEALALLQRASPFPAPPDQLPGLTFYFTQPITLVR
jgi:protein TonB